MIRNFMNEEVGLCLYGDYATKKLIILFESKQETGFHHMGIQKKLHVHFYQCSIIINKLKTKDTYTVRYLDVEDVRYLILYT